MATTIHLDFDPYDDDHRRAAAWLAAQPNPAEAIVRLIRAGSIGERRLRQWEEMATLLANEVQQVRRQLPGQPPSTEPQTEIEENHEDPESVERLDSLFQ